MKTVHFNIYFCGINSDYFSEQIRIFKPHYNITETFTSKNLSELGIFNMSELVNHMKTYKTVQEHLGEWGMENFTFLTTYVQHQDYLLALAENKAIFDIFDYFNVDKLEFSYFVVGGASLHNETGYRFTVHSDEKIHEYMPHVHVSKADIDIRYSLDSLLPIDPLIFPHKRDNKKIILPFLKKNQNKLLEMWNHNLNGYLTPEIAEDGTQFYNES